MKELFQKAIEWLRSRVTALKNTQGVYVDVNDNENPVKVRDKRLAVSEVRTSKVERRHRNDDDKSFNSHLSTQN